MSVTIEPLPIENLPHEKVWATTLTEVASKPLALRSDFPQLAQRYGGLVAARIAGASDLHCQERHGPVSPDHAPIRYAR